MNFNSQIIKLVELLLKSQISAGFVSHRTSMLGVLGSSFVSGLTSPRRRIRVYISQEHGGDCCTVSMAMTDEMVGTARLGRADAMREMVVGMGEMVGMAGMEGMALTARIVLMVLMDRMDTMDIMDTMEEIEEMGRNAS